MLGNVLIVGGSASIAPEVVSAFGANARGLTVTYRQPPPAPAAGIAVLACDLEDSESIRAAAQCCCDLDVVVLLAGAITGVALAEASDAEIDRLTAVNLSGPARLIRDLMPRLSKGARILLVSSIAGERGSFDSVYAATKGGMIALAKSLATWRGSDFTTFVVAPGLIEQSAMLNGMAPHRIEHHRSTTPAGELLNRVDLARILVDLAQPHWRHANGAVIRVNGGAYV